MSAVTITNWVYESPASLRAKALIALQKAKELEKIKQLNKQ
mgnify:FL=1